MSLGQIKILHPAGLLLRLTWLWGVEIIAGQYCCSSYHSLIYINQIKCVLRCPTKTIWKAATALLSTRGQCLTISLFLSVHYNHCTRSRLYLSRTCVARRSSLNVASIVYLWRDEIFLLLFQVSPSVVYEMMCRAV